MALSDSKLRALRATGTRFELPDRDGLALRVGSSGSMTWTVTFTVRGAGAASGLRVKLRTGDRRRTNIGIYPAMSLSEAREAAQGLVRLARSGTDPRPPEALPAAAAARAATVSDLIARYTRDHLDRNLGSGNNVERLLWRHVEPQWGDRPLAELRATDLVNLLERVRLPSGALVCATGHAQHYATVRGGPACSNHPQTTPGPENHHRQRHHHHAGCGLTPNATCQRQSGATIIHPSASRSPS